MANIARFHRAARGSIPRIGGFPFVFFPMQKYAPYMVGPSPCSLYRSYHMS